MAIHYIDLLDLVIKMNGYLCFDTNAKSNARSLKRNCSEPLEKLAGMVAKTLNSSIGLLLDHFSTPLLSLPQLVHFQL